MMELANLLQSLAGPPDTALGLLAGWAVRSTLLLAAAFGISLLLSRARAPLRHWLWAVTFAGLLALPAVSLTAPELALPVLPAATPPAPSHQESSSAAPVAQGLNRPSVTLPARSDADPRAEMAAGSIGWVDRLFFLYLAGVLACLGYLAAGIARVAAITRRAAPSRDPFVSSGVRLLVSSEIEVPLAWGWRRPAVLMPAGWRNWPSSYRRDALVHEMAHLSRGDWPVLMTARLVSALLWFHPLVWMALRRLILEAEKACDDAVVSSGARASGYARQILELAASKPRRLAQPAAVAMAGRSPLSGRILAILDPRPRRETMRYASRFVVLAACLTLTASLGAAQLRRGAAELRQSDPLLQAAWSGDANEVRRLLASGADPNLRAPGLRTPLILASYQGHENIVRMLLAAGADPNLHEGARSRLWPEVPRSALTAAASGGHGPLVDLLIASGADIEAAPAGDPTPLMAAAGTNITVTARLVEAGAEVDRPVRGDGSALIFAARSGDAEAVQLLLDAGADPNLPVRGDGSPLIAAAGGGHAEVVRVLLARGADPDLVVRGDGSPLAAAQASGNPEVVRLLLEAGADPDLAPRGDGSALMQAVGRGDRQMAEHLLESGADPNLAVRGDGNALIEAARKADLAMIDFLVRRGADPNAGVDGDGNPLIAAVRSGSVAAVDLLIDLGADPNGAVIGDGNALIAAAAGGDPELVRLLLARGAHVDAVVPGDENPLINAARHGHLDVAEVLLDARADVNVVVESDGRVYTPLGEALRKGHGAMADLLRSRGARR